MGYGDGNADCGKTSINSGGEPAPPPAEIHCSGYLLPMRSEIGRIDGGCFGVKPAGLRNKIMQAEAHKRTCFTSLGLWEVP